MWFLIRETAPSFHPSFFVFWLIMKIVKNSKSSLVTKYRRKEYKTKNAEGKNGNFSNA